MSELQIYLLAGGAVFIVAVIAYNVWTERRAKGKAEKAFGERPGDALFQPKPVPTAPVERREPTLGRMPEPAPVAVPVPAQPVEPEELEAPGGPAAQISSRIDTVAVILADDPVRAEQLEPLLQALGAHRHPVHVEGIVDEQWQPVDESGPRSWRELRVGLQLASRAGPLAEEEIERFNRAIADFAAGLGAVSQREAPAAAAARAKELDAFCAEADIEVAVNVVGQFGAPFTVSRVKTLALEHGMSETADGEMVSFGDEGDREFTIRAFDDPKARPAAGHFGGLTFVMDLPHVPDPAAVLADMVGVAESFAAKLPGQLVDDNRRPLTEAGLASIRRTVDKIMADMQSHGVPAGGALARRLFS